MDGRCEDVPRSCPCPKETCCDLSTNTCKMGCTNDAQCASGRVCDRDVRQCPAGCRTDGQYGRGQICDGLTCRPGCLRDGDCMLSGSICDMATLTCQKGCHRNSDCGMPGIICDGATQMCRAVCQAMAECAKEQICAPMTARCVAVCDSDDRCNSGRICETEACVDGYHNSASCPLGQYCNTVMKKCVVGCNGDKSRCAVGEACVRLQNGGYRCDAKCHGWERNGAGWACYATYSSGAGTDYVNARCRKGCASNADCPMGEPCTVFTSRPAVPSMNQVRYCARPRDVAGCTSAVDGYAMPGRCSCAMDGACKTDMGMGYVCYQISPSYGP